MQQAKKTYKKPELSGLGTVTELTAGGSGVQNESNQGQGQPNRQMT